MNTNNRLFRAPRLSFTVKELEGLKNLQMLPGGVMMLPEVGRNKYHAKRAEYGGRSYHSRAEARYAFQLDCRLKQKEIVSWSPQIPFPFTVNGVLICKYVMDFRVEYPNGLIEWVEVKGKRTEEFKIKKNLFQALYLFAHPEERYTIVEADMV